MGKDGSKKKRKLNSESVSSSDTVPQKFAGLEELLGGGENIKVDPETFLKEYWEKKPLVIKRKDAAYFKGKTEFEKKDLLKLAKERKTFRYGRDLNVVKCEVDEGSGSQRKVVVHELDELVKAEGLEKFFKDGATVQFFQPQRFVDSIHRLLYNLENDFTCLAGANVYLTPANTQGLAPHYDDVDVFVLQTEGSKRWHLHEKGEAFQELAMSCSEDLSSQEMGPKYLEVVLEQGDMLYLPRGFIHYAQALDSHSTHITVSTYQNQTYYNFMESCFPNLLDAAASSDLEFRRGILPGYLNNNGTLNVQTGGPQPGPFCKKVASLLRRMADHLESSSAQQEESLAEAFHESVDAFASDFMVSRLPPPSAPSSKKHKTNNKITAKSLIQLQDPKFLHLTIDDPQEDEDDLDMDMGAEEMDDDSKDDKNEDENDNDDDDDAIRVFNSLRNDRTTHMVASMEMENAPENECVLPIMARDIILQLRKAYPNPIRVSDLEFEQDQRTLVELLEKMFDYEIVRFNN